MSIDARLAAPRSERAKVVIVASQWGTNWGERSTAIRLCAGALALSADVTIVSLDDRSSEENAPLRRTFDGIFPVHSASAPPAHPRVREVLRASLARAEGTISPQAGALPDIAARGLLGLDGQPSSEALGIIEHLQPDIVVMAGVETLWLGEGLPVGPTRPRVVFLPLLGADARLASSALEPLAEIVDAIGVFSHVEGSLLLRSVGVRDRSMVQRLSLSFPVNHHASHFGLAGMAGFGRYVLIISGWPDDDPAVGMVPPHDYVREMVGDVSVAEVRHGRWLITRRGERFDVPWSANRMNLWRLMAGAVATVDVRPPGPIGREAIESMMFATPVVVREGTVAAEHARLAGGGLWYSAPGEMLDAMAYLLDHDDEQAAFAKAGREWAEREHGDTERLVTEVAQLVLG